MKLSRINSSWTFLEKSVLVVACGIASGALASELSLNDAPLFLESSVQPNINFIVDDSGSMNWVNLGSKAATTAYPDAAWEWVDDLDWTPNVNGLELEDIIMACSGVNVLYYDPRQTYTPWSGEDKLDAAFVDQALSTARREPFEGVDSITTGGGGGGGGGGGTTSNIEDLTDDDDDGDYPGFFTWYDQNGNGEFDIYVDLDDDDEIDYFVDLNDNNDFDGFVDLNNNGIYDPGEFESELECPNATMPLADLQEWFIGTNEMDDSAQNEIGMGQGDSTDVDYDASLSEEINPLTGAEMKTNFANWFTYYRKREFVAKRALSEIITNSTARVGLTTLHNNNSVNIDIKDVDDVSTPIDTTAESNKDALLYNVFNVDSENGTPLRSTLKEVGEYFKEDPATGPILTSELGGRCQQNFAIMLTDGVWNGSNPGTVGNADTDGNSDYDGRDEPSYRDAEDSISQTLADVAMYYYENDLQPLMDAEVEPYINETLKIYDTNEQQHLVTYTVAFGVTGNLTDDHDPWADDFAGWPTPVNDEDSTIDDVWHAAHNGRGLFLSAADPEELISSLGAAVSDISKRQGAASAVAVNSGSISSESMVFQATFNSTFWSGELTGYPILDDGSIDTTDAEVETASIVPNEIYRVIVTHDGASGVPFQWDNLAEDQQTTLVSVDLVDYLRGDDSLEGTETSDYRERDDAILAGAGAPLGDIINSSPVYVGDPEFLYGDELETVVADDGTESYASYSDFRLNPDGDGLYQDLDDGKRIYRNPVLYVGSNDGFLHAFDVNPSLKGSSDFGKEIFAYVPSMVMSRLPDLASQGYVHDYTVDGSPTVADAFINSAWNTVLVSGLNAGGQGIFALDVTNPNSFDNETNAATKVLWEFSDEDDADMGYSYSKPIIVKSNYNGKWVAIFGNGYGNTNTNISTTVADTNIGGGTPVLFIVDLETGALIKKIDTGVNVRSSVPNGLSSPISLDQNGDYIADYVYAGDLEGNLWKFDISNSDKDQWDVAFGTSTDKKPLYTACSEDSCDDDNRQPITIQPKVGINRGATDHIIYFGTGTYILENDNTNDSLQSFYGIWDRHQTATTFTAFDRRHLLEQEILEEYTVEDTDTETGVTTSTEQRLTSRNILIWHTEDEGLPNLTDPDDESHLGWRLDFVNTDVAAADREVGERLVTDISLRDEEVFFNTSIPSADPCAGGGDGWFMALDATTGSGPDDPVIDVNLDGQYDEGDIVAFSSAEAPSSGTKTPALATGCVFVTLTDGSQVCLSNPSTGGVVTSTGVAAGAALGRWMWRELND